MVRKKKDAQVSEDTKYRSKRILSEPLSGSKLNENGVNVNIINVNERGVIILPREVRNKLNMGRSCELVLLTMVDRNEASTIMLIPVSQLTQGDRNNRSTPRAAHGSD